MHNNHIGSKWWKFDFHNHTPTSDDYGKGINQEEFKNITPKEWLLNYMRQGIDCVAITDHNSGAWIDPLKVALEELKVESHTEYRPLTLFPGVEITVQGNIHILAIFDSSKSTSDVDSLLGAVRYRATKGKSDGCTDCSATEVVDEIIAFNGIAIPAHVDQPSGLFTVFSGNTLNQVLSNPHILAMEVVDTNYDKPALYTNAKTDWAEVIGSDSHHPTGEPGHCFPGSKYTWVKMSEPTIDGLRLALIDGAMSLKRSDVCNLDPNSHAQLIIERIVVDEARYLGRGNSFEIKLSPWLNTIIGGRGTGKSTSLEFIRNALNRRSEIPESLQGDLSKYDEASTSRVDNGLLTSSTSITVYFKKEETSFRVALSNISNSANSHIIEELTSDGTWILSDGDISNRFPIRIYSQKQIFELAKHPQALLKIIDNATSVDYRSWKTVWESLVNRYYTICASQRELEAGLEEENLVKGQLEDIDRKLAIFESAGNAHILQSYRLKKNQDIAITQWEESWESKANDLRLLASEILPPGIVSEHLSSSNEIDKEILNTTSDIIEDFRVIQNEVNELAEKIELIRNNWLEKKSALQFSVELVTAKGNYDSLIEQLGSAGVDKPSEYSDLLGQKQQLSEELNSFNIKKIKIEDHKRDAKACLDSIDHHRAELSRLRRDFLHTTLSDNRYVKITAIFLQDKSALVEEFRELIGRKNNGFERDIGDSESSEGILLPLIQASPNNIKEKLSELKQKIVDIHCSNSDVVDSVIDQRFTKHIQTLRPEQIDRIQVWFPNDFLEVKYSLKGQARFSSVEQGSPGQKTAALLAFIFSYGEEPLLLDQPEDDLDNHLIYDLIVTQLKKIKSKRQVIIATHNANIVVNGDAENIVALDIRRGSTQIVAQGGLQEKAIRDQVCRIMEGGKDAFRLRYKRLGEYGGE